MSRKYTGWDGDAKGRRAGTEKFVQLTCAYFNNGVTNFGTWNVRPSRGASGKPSVHGTGRAADLLWDKKDDGRGFGNYEAALKVLDFFVANADLLMIEEIHDYFLTPHGRGWKCDRQAWKIYDKPTIGTPGGKWWHVEIAPDHADDPGYYDQAFKLIASGAAPVAAPAPVATSAQPAEMKFAYPGKAVKAGSKGDAVKLVQAVIGATVDGDFGPASVAKAKEWQKAHGIAPVDGIVGKQTWAVMFGA